ncbi:MAG TPA: hypothetical protein VMU99_01245 [Acidimicrobiales bacterium]|nr:hypothetical protein [Acidimicrobiales bacterium]
MSHTSLWRNVVSERCNLGISSHHESVGNRFAAQHGSIRTTEAKTESALIPEDTSDLKTAISHPNGTFDRASRRAKDLGLSRSEFFARGAKRYLDELEVESVTKQIKRPSAVLTAAIPRRMQSLWVMGWWPATPAGGDRSEYLLRRSGHASWLSTNNETTGLGDLREDIQPEQASDRSLRGDQLQHRICDSV